MKLGTIGVDLARKRKPQEPKDLTDKQLEWLRANVPAFKVAEAAVIKSDENAKRIADAIGKAA